ncbi:SOS response-associated peptidase [Andreprevotia chitinilytica]|uniref:SOS response-associated peptidase n=1 Tax=Andreprevotia chitinilytica TaxID=396808 RepID=UPI0005530079|nr:SOS response-associated peptidase [Andreprevotia chitinilytica]
MCGRFTHSRSLREYGVALGWIDKNDDTGTRNLLQVGNRWPFYNLAPGTCPDVMHRLPEGKRCIDTIRWGYRPAWAADRQMKDGKPYPVVINARAETVSTKPYYAPLWEAGRRVLVPADGWYEWPTTEAGKVPHYITRKDREPLFLAALTGFIPYTAGQDKHEAGFVILTQDSLGGMVDVHDRRPVVFGPEQADQWADLDTPIDRADHLMRHESLPGDVFEWWPVSQLVNNPKNNDPSLIVRIE